MTPIEPADAPPADAAPPADRATVTLDVEQAVVELYRTVNERVKSHARAFNPDLQPAGFGILRYIKAREPIRAAEIATSLGMDKSAVSRQISALREMGLVETTPDPLDGRASLLVLSGTSRDALSGIQDRTTTDYDRALSAWSDSDLLAFAQMLKRFTTAL